MWKMVRRGSNCRGICNEDNDDFPLPVKQRLESWVETDIASPDTPNVHDEINRVAIQQQCNKRLQCVPTDTVFDAVQQGLARISTLLVGNSYTQATQRQEELNVHRRRFSAADTLWQLITQKATDTASLEAPSERILQVLHEMQYPLPRNQSWVKAQCS